MGDCEFNDSITDDSGAWSWSDDQTDECREAWQILTDLGIIVDGEPSTEAVTAAENMDIELANPALPGILGGTFSSWRKVFVASWNDEGLITSSGKSFELHFYRTLSNAINTSIDFKIVFKDPIP